MSQHLDAGTLAAAVAGLELAPAAAAHLAACVSCRRSVDETVRALGARRDQLANEAPDWAAQRQAILARLPAPVVSLAPRRRLRPLLALAAFILVGVLGLGLWRLDLARRPESPSLDERLALEQVLAEADALLADDSIPGFEPIDPFADSDLDWTEVLANSRPGGAS